MVPFVNILGEKSQPCILHFLKFTSIKFVQEKQDLVKSIFSKTVFKSNRRDKPTNFINKKLHFINLLFLYLLLYSWYNTDCWKLVF